MRTVSGDAGGPLLIPHFRNRSISRGRPKSDMLVALASFGDKSCEDDDVPGGYTLVGPFRDWITSVLESVSEPEEPVRETSLSYYFDAPCRIFPWQQLDWFVFCLKSCIVHMWCAAMSC